MVLLESAVLSSPTPRCRGCEGCTHPPVKLSRGPLLDESSLWRVENPVCETHTHTGPPPNSPLCVCVCMLGQSAQSIGERPRQRTAISTNSTDSVSELQRVQCSSDIENCARALAGLVRWVPALRYAGVGVLRVPCSVFVTSQSVMVVRGSADECSLASCIRASTR